MSTNIKTIEGTYHVYPRRGSFEVKHEKAELHLTRFYNGIEYGRAIQLTVSNADSTSYIHLTEKQCKELAKVLKECFDNNKYPSE